MFEKYARFTVEDFVKEERFIQWVRISESHEKIFWSDFIKAHPHQRETVFHARQIVLQLSEASRIAVDAGDSAAIWKELEAGLLQDVRPLRAFFGSGWSKWISAASVLFLLGALAWSKGLWQPTPAGAYEQLTAQERSILQEVVNTKSTPLTVTLPDGSTVVLERETRLSYTKNFSGKNREVFLSGAAFFNVVKNPGRPFMVYANELVTKVLGTSFNIVAYELDKHVTVSVKSGKVSVFASKYNNIKDPESKGIVLVPNQQAAFLRANETLTRALVSEPRLIVSDEELKDLVFSNVPVSSIFEAMEKAYGVKILFDGEQIAGCRLTTSLSDETMFERLDIVCEAIEASYTVVDAQVIISGKKCN